MVPISGNNLWPDYSLHLESEQGVRNGQELCFTHFFIDNIIIHFLKLENTVITLDNRAVIRGLSEI